MTGAAFDHKRQVRRFYERLWDDHDTSVINSLLTADCRFRGSLGQEKRGHEGIAQYVDGVHAALGDYRCRIDEFVAEDSKVFAKMRFTGIHRAEFMGYAATGQTLSWHGAALFTFAGDLIDEVWVLGDVHGLLRQLSSQADPDRD